MDIADAAALIFAAVIAGTVAFQIALALGAPWGAYAMGGAFPGRFPPRMRVAAVVQAIVLAALAVVVLSAAALLLPGLVAGAPWVAWVPVVVSTVSLVLNALTPSPGERRIWVPVAVALSVSSLVVALSAR